MSPLKLGLIAVGIASAIIVIRARAHEIEQGTSVFCDTQAQIEKFAALDAQTEALKIINADTPDACAMVEVAYIRANAADPDNSMLRRSETEQQHYPERTGVRPRLERYCRQFRALGRSEILPRRPGG